MMYIVEGARLVDSGKVYEWHIGEPVPPIESKVVIFQADGDELYLILKKMRQVAQKEGRKI